MPKGNYSPGRNRRIPQPGSEGGAIQGVYQLRVAEVIPKEGVIIVDCEKWTVFGTPSVPVEVFGIISVMGDVEVRLARNGEEIPIAIQETGPSTFTITAPELLDGDDLSVEEYARPMISKGGLQCVGLAYTLQLCPTPAPELDVNISFEPPDDPAIFETVRVEGDLNDGLYEGTSTNFGPLELFWDSELILPKWVIRFASYPPGVVVLLISQANPPQRCDPADGALYFADEPYLAATVTLP